MTSSYANNILKWLQSDTPDTPGLFNPFRRRRFGWSYLGDANAFEQRLREHGYSGSRNLTPVLNANVAYGNLVGLNDLEETDDDIQNAWEQYISANAAHWAPALRSYANTKRNEVIADYRAARAQDPSLRFAQFLAGLDMERNWLMADAQEAFRFNPYYRSVFLRRR